MSQDWTKISAKEAERHPLYGISGWIVFFAAWLAIGFLLSYGSIAQTLKEQGSDFWSFIESGTPLADITKYELIVRVLSACILYVSLFRKDPDIRYYVSVLSLGPFAVMFLIAAISPMEGSLLYMMHSGMGWLISALIWIAYFQRSRRVRVTFEYKVRADDPYLTLLQRRTEEKEREENEASSP